MVEDTRETLSSPFLLRESEREIKKKTKAEFKFVKKMMELLDH